MDPPNSTMVRRDSCALVYVNTITSVSRSWNWCNGIQILQNRKIRRSQLR